VAAAAALLCASAWLGQAAADTSDALQEITVTATKLGTSLSKSPVSASEISAAQIEDYNIQTVQDAQALVPDLVYNDAHNHGEAYIRGVGSNFSLAGAESSVATYVDGAYLQRQIGANVNLLDVQSVEVLKGPQSALYGRDATGGAIVIQNKLPTQELEGWIAGERGNFDHYDFSGMMNVPITSTLALRVVGQISYLGNWITNVSTGPDKGGDLGGYDKRYARAKLLWNPTSEFTAILTEEYVDDLANDYPQHMRVGAPGCLACALYGVPPPGNNFYSVTGNDLASAVGSLQAGRNGYQSQINYSATTLQLIYDLPSYVFTSVSSLRNGSFLDYSEEDRTVANLEYAEVNESGPTLTQDFYVRSKYDGPINFLLGGFYERERNTQISSLEGTIFGGIPEVGQSYLAGVDAAALYTEVTYKFTPAWSFTASARGNEEWKTGSASNDAGGALIGGTPGYYESVRHGDVTPRGVLAYSPGEDYYYASYSIGAKSAFFTSPSFAPLPPLQEEKIKEWEVGAKNKLFDGALQTSAAIFYGTWDNIVVQYDDPQAGGIRAQNAAGAKTYGAELNADWRVTEQLDLAWSGAYLHNYFTNYRNASVFAQETGLPGFQNVTENLTGTVMPRSPKLTTSLSANYHVPVGGGWKTVTSVVARYTTWFDFIAGGGGPDNYDVQPGYLKVDGSITLSDPRNVFNIAFYGTNLTGTKYADYAATDSLGPFYTAAPPRLVGIRLTRKF
jgi:iron complex outermembrane receptor protein